MRRLFATAAIIAFSTAAFAEVPSYTIVIKDHKFEPATVEIPADTKVKLLVDNQDPTPEEFESHDFHREKIIKGNSKATINVGPLKAGEYKFFGEFNEKTAQGKLVVK
jgi:plastocyanin